MESACWPYFDPEYENLSQRINPPRVCVDNTTCSDCTVVKVDSVNKPGTLLEVVQVLIDLDLAISKAYISSDGGWFMDVFHVTDQQGNKITDPNTIQYIENTLGPKASTTLQGQGKPWPGKSVGVHTMGDYNVIELVGTDRPGILSEISAILANLHCNVVGAEVWTHRMRVACLVYINDDQTCRAIDDPEKLSAMEEQLKNVLRGRGDDAKGARTSFTLGATHTDRRLHQMMFDDRDYEDGGGGGDNDDMGPFKPIVTIDRWADKGYSVVNIRCKDRSKLLFDIVCTLTDMQYVVFHASIGSEGPYAIQEYYIRHMDGCTLNTEGEKERVIKCIEAAILRRVSEGVRLEICGRDRVGLLADVTRVLRENGLSVRRAGVSTVGNEGINVFYVRDASGVAVEPKAIEALRREIGNTVRLSVRKTTPGGRAPQPNNGWNKSSFFFSFGGLLDRFLA